MRESKKCNYEELLRYVSYKKALPINGYPAVYIPELDSTVICDIHLGYEEEMSREGIIIPRIQTEKLKSKIESMSEVVSSKKLIINGDIRHGFKKTTKKEYKEIESFLIFVSSFYKEVILVKGNHDTFIRPIAKQFGFPLIDYFYDKDFLIIHGHEEYADMINKSKIIIIGHEHPAIKMVDEDGNYRKYLAIFYVPTEFCSVMVLVPPFSIFASGTAINEKPNPFSGIAKKYAIIEEGIPFLIDDKLGTIELPQLKFIQ